MELVNCATWFEKIIHQHTVCEWNGDGRKIITNNFTNCANIKSGKNATPFVEAIALNSTPQKYNYTQHCGPTFHLVLIF